jgi:DNA adenine methylase
VTASPFLKWAGGKSQLLDRILPQLPEQIATYYEPFIGGGAVFFALATRRRFRNAVISDRNPALVEVYETVRDDVEGLIDLLSAHSKHATDSDYYYEVRAQRPKRSLERAARILFLNKTCYNGLYRVNRRGEFNVPFGRYSNPRVLNEALLRAASDSLRGVEIVHSDFGPIADRAERDDAVYFDPPYHPVSQTASFTAYDSTAFGMPEQERLAASFRDLCGRTVSCVLSNSDCEATRSLYEGLDVKTVFASRAINSRAEKRGPVTELLVVNKPTMRMRVVRGAA